MSTVEREALALWKRWAHWQKFTTCGCCHVFRYCGLGTRRGRWLCPPCFDTSPEAERFLGRSM